MRGKKSDKDIEDSNSNLQVQIAELRESLDRVAKPYEELSQKINMLGDYAQRYLKLLGILASNGALSPALAVPDVKDSIAKDIITILAEKNPLNLSQITDALREKRGSASRRIVREKVKELAGMGHIVVIAGKIKGYSLSEEVVRKWSQMLTGLK